MAQKKAAAAAKKPAAKGNKRGPKPKQVVEEKPKEVEPSEDESEEEQNGVVSADEGSNSEVIEQIHIDAICSICNFNNSFCFNSLLL